MPAPRPYGPISLGRDLVFASTTDVFSAAAERIAALHPGVAADELFARITSPACHCASLRGKLLLLELACPGLDQPHAFYLLGTAGRVVWHGAPLRLFLFGLYHPEAIRSYVLASTHLYRDKLTPEGIRSWLHGDLWPE